MTISQTEPASPHVVCFGHVATPGIPALLEGLAKGLRADPRAAGIRVAWRSTHGDGQADTDEWAHGLASSAGLTLLDDVEPEEVRSRIATAAAVIVLSDTPDDGWHEAVCAHAAVNGVPMLAPAGGATARALQNGLVNGGLFTPWNAADLVAHVRQVLELGSGHQTAGERDAGDSQRLDARAAVDRLLTAVTLTRRRVETVEQPTFRDHNSMEQLDDLLAALAALPGDWHGAGCLEMPNIEAIARHASSRRIRRSVETGAGKTTLLLSHLSDQHVVFAVDDGGSLSRTRESLFLRKHAVTFVEGPTQRTLMAHEFTEPIQFALIDGPHGFPFPNLEYWKIYPHLEPGGLLVLDDIHIPTIRQLFEFLREDDMFTLLETVGKTAFFERTHQQTFSPVEDGWWLQRYNARRFPVQYEHIGLGFGEIQNDPSVYRERLLPLIERWVRDQVRVAIFGTGGHTDFLFHIVPELERVRIVAYLETALDRQGAEYRGVAIRPPAWTPGQAEVVLCSSYANELSQLEFLDTIPVKAVLSHPPCRGRLTDDRLEAANDKARAESRGLDGAFGAKSGAAPATTA